MILPDPPRGWEWRHRGIFGFKRISLVRTYDNLEIFYTYEVVAVAYTAGTKRDIKKAVKKAKKMGDGVPFPGMFT